MTTDNRTNEPTPEQVEAAAKAMHGTRNHWFAAYGDWGAAGFEIKKAFRESARAALVAAASVAPVVQRVSESDALALVEEVIAIHADRIGTHYEDCYKYHVACLAVAVKRRIAGKEQNE